MPVSPQDFELYSRMTGAPMPTDAMSRMQMAPDVYNFTKSFARKPNLFEKTGNLVKNIGRGAVMALGAPLVAASMAEEARMQEQLRNQADIAESDSVTTENPTEEVADTPAMAKIRLQMEADAVKHQQKLELQDRMDARALGKSTGVSGVVQTNLNPPQKSGPKPIGKTPDGQLLYDAADLSTQEPTTADTYGQDYVPNQTSSNIVDRKIEQGSQIADSTPNVAEVLSESQDSTPVDFADPVKVQQQMEAEMVGKSKGKRQLSKFMGRENIDKALLGAIIEGKQIKPEMFGEALSADSNLLDHPDLPGGEDDIGLPSGTNTSPTTNLQEKTGGGESLNKRYVDHAEEMRRMEAQERRKRKSPSERQINLLEQRAIANKEAIDSGFMSMSDEERANETDRLGGGLTPPSALDKANGFLSNFPPQSMIRYGQMGSKASGIELNPSPNGDPTIGFAISDPKAKKTTKYVYPANKEVIQELSQDPDDPETSDESLGRKKFNYLLGLAGRGEKGIGERTNKEVFDTFVNTSKLEM